ncbi:MAG: ATP-binding protein, partial [Methanoregulaceae archaeon]|nr:ATP-binding protein [Methanoregulaceae archaeon]
MHLIETRDLAYVYPGSVKALEGINFIAPRNARIAVIGSNGAG